MARAGAFSANFAPETLEAFRTRCSAKGEKYTKVLERLAEYWLETDGDCLNDESVPASGSQSGATSTTPTSLATESDLYKRIDRLEEANEYVEETLNGVLLRMNSLEESIIR